VGSGRRALLLLLAGAAVLAAPARGEVTVKLRERKSYEVEGAFQAPVPRATAWKVLTDYEHIGDFVPAVKRSWMVERRGDEALVGQNISGTLLFFSRRIVLRLSVREDPMEGLSFRDVLGRDFDAYAGAWTLEDAGDGTRVVYRLRAEPKFHIPPFIVRGVLKREAQDLLRGIRREMLRRQEAER
jgi:carbon monoxide dehydrogenase subunit G